MISSGFLDGSCMCTFSLAVFPLETGKAVYIPCGHRFCTLSYNLTIPTLNVYRDVRDHIDNSPCQFVYCLICWDGRINFS